MARKPDNYLKICRSLNHRKRHMNSLSGQWMWSFIFSGSKCTDIFLKNICNIIPYSDFGLLNCICIYFHLNREKDRTRLGVMGAGVLVLVGNRNRESLKQKVEISWSTQSKQITSKRFDTQSFPFSKWNSSQDVKIGLTYILEKPKYCIKYLHFD